MLKKVGLVAVLTLVSAFLAAGAVQALPQSSDQQKCILKMNKDGTKLQETQGKENYRCVKIERNEDASTDVDACIANDDRNKITKKKAKTLRDYTKFCSLATQVPDFAYTDPNTVNETAVRRELDLLDDMFADPNGDLDPNVYDCDPLLTECRCQQTVLLRVEKLFAQMGREYYICKKNALKVEMDPFPLGADDPNDIASCVDDPTTEGSVAADFYKRMQDRIDDLEKAIIDRTCNAAGIQEPFGGPACNRAVFGGSPSDDQLRDCLASRVYCHFCQMINEMDDLAVDCQAFVTQEVGYGTCP